MANMQNDCVRNRGKTTQVNCALVEYGMLLSHDNLYKKISGGWPLSRQGNTNIGSGRNIFGTITMQKPVFKIRFFGADLSSQAELFTSKKLPKFE